MVLKSLVSPLDHKEIKSVNPKENQSWIFIGRTDAEAETPILWPPDAKNLFIGKGPDAGKDWRQETGMTEDEMAGWHHWLDGHEFGWTLGAGEGQGGLACCDSWDRKELDTTERLNWTELKYSGLSRPSVTDFPSRRWQVHFHFLGTLSLAPKTKHLLIPTSVITRSPLPFSSWH